MKDLTNPQEAQVDILSTCSKDEISTLIANAKQHPRDIKNVLANIRKLATIDEDTADGCFYAVMKDGKIIEGVSVRLVEIMALCWGNLRISTRIKANDGRMITAQSTCHDLENNYSVSVESQRSILAPNGSSESGNMQVLSGSAASSVAFRNAVLKVIPKTITQKVIAEIREFVLSGTDIEDKLNTTLNWFQQKGVSKEKILAYLNIGTISEINKEKLLTLRATMNAINESSATVNELFKASIPERKEKIKSKAKSKKPINLP